MWKAYSRIEKFMIPGIVNPQLAYREVLRTHINSETLWLDLGCGHKFFSNALPDSENSQIDLVRYPKLQNTACQGIPWKLKDLRMLQGPADSVMFGPLVIFELIWMKFLSVSWMQQLRSNMVVLIGK